MNDFASITETGFVPDLTVVRFIACAITPPPFHARAALI